MKKIPSKNLKKAKDAIKKMNNKSFNVKSIAPIFDQVYIEGIKSLDSLD